MRQIFRADYGRKLFEASGSAFACFTLFKQIVLNSYVMSMNRLGCISGCMKSAER